MNADQIARFWSLVNKTDSCWLWTGRFSKSGYGKFLARGTGIGRNQRAHRVAWMIANGPIPVGLFVCHRCDTPACVRLDHLFLGTPKENTNDARIKGRLRTGPIPAESIRRGEANVHSKLTESDVVRIRELSADGLSQSRIGILFGINQTTVSGIILGHSWSHVGGPTRSSLSFAERGRRSKQAA